MSFFVHPQAICESEQVGEGTRIWAFAHVLPGAVIGANVNVCDGVFIENDVVIGDDVTLKCGVQVWDGITLEDRVFVGPNVTFTNDPYPRSKKYPEEFARTRVGEGASLGGGAVILPGITIGRGAMIGAGAVVTRDVPPFAIVRGNPARITGYDSESPDVLGRPFPAPDGVVAPGGVVAPVDGGPSSIVRLATDLRGSLAAIEFADCPFVPQRLFVVYGVPSQDVRGQHAHRECEQLLVCLAGSVTCLLDDGVHRSVTVLDSPGKTLHIPPMVWGSQFHYSPDAVLAVLASLPYDDADYIREYDDFRREIESLTSI